MEVAALIGALKKWEITHRSYAQGELLTDENSPLAQAHLILVASGVVEVFETVICSGRTAYRPITIFKAGEMVSLFKLMDLYCALDSPAREKEEWRIAAGSASTLLLTPYERNAAEQLYADRLGDEAFDEISKQLEPRHLLPALLGKHVSEVYFYRFDGIAAALREIPAVFDILIKQSWRGLQGYRLSRNTYNQVFYNRIFSRVWSSVFDQVRKANSQVPDKEGLFAEIIYAAIEALERPALNSPMFFKTNIEPAPRKRGDRDEIYKNLTLATVLRAFHPDDVTGADQVDPTMHYPLGLQNVSIGRFMNTRFFPEGGTARTESFGNAVTFIAPTDRKAIKQSDIGTILTKTIKEFREEYKAMDLDYPFDVEISREIRGSDGRYMPILLVHRRGR